MEQINEQEAKPEQPEAPKQPANPMPLDKLKAMAPRTATELTSMLAYIAKGGAFPSRFKTGEERLAAYSLANQLMKERWQLALNNIANIKGQMTIFGELPGAVAEQTKEVSEKLVFVIDSEYNEICMKNRNFNATPYAGVCIIQRKDREKKEFYYTIDEAKAAGQYPAKMKDGSPNPDSPWMKHTKIMLMRKAMNQAIKFEFPDAMLGVPVAEYDYDLAPDLEPRTVTESAADQLNKEYLDDAKAQVTQ